MIRYSCPICTRRACDSNKVIVLDKLSADNENTADIVIKCQNCKNLLAVTVSRDTFDINQMSLRREGLTIHST